MSVLDEVEVMKKGNKAEGEATQPEVAPLDVVVAEPRQELMTTEAVKKGLDGAIKRTIDSGKDIKDLARDLTYLKGASDLQGNDEFTEVYKQELGKQLVKDLEDEGKRAAIKASAQRIEATNIRNKAYYDSFKPIFKLLGIEEAYGLIPMVITTILLMIPFLAVSVVRFAINSVNEIFTSIAKFTKPAYLIASVIVIGLIVIACLLGLLYGIEATFGVEIFKKVTGM